MSLAAGHIEVDIACQYRPHVTVDPEVVAFLEARGKKLPTTTARLAPVPDDRLSDWARSKVERAGLTIDSLSVTRLPDARLGRRRSERVPAARISARVESSDQVPNALADAIHHGLGRAKNYGLGMVRVLDS